MKRLISVLIMAMLLTACSSSSDEKEREKEVVDAVHQPLEKAKDVEQQIFDSDARQRKQMDDL
ncbi:MAG: hypothetical protein PHH11_00265 [Methylomonas sp.]|nr:hypothetical protein [Methylomonas sp.]